MTQLRCLDLCSGAGGASMGLHRAGFDVTGVDIAPQKRYPFAFIQADALTLSLDFLRGFDLVWASWPCQKWARTKTIWAGRGGKEHPDLLTPGRALLQAAGVPYILENVIGAPLRDPITLCGEMFGLRVQRHRRFESNYLLLQPPHMPHRVGNVTQVGRMPTWEDAYLCVAGHFAGVPEARAAMGIDWMMRDELSQAIPPAYSEYLGRQMYAALQRRPPDAA